MNDIEKASGTEVWELLDTYAAMIRSGVSCEQLGGIIIDLTDLASKQVYLSEIEKCLGVLQQANDLYYKECTDESFSLDGWVEPDSFAGYLAFSTSPDVTGELGILNFLVPLIIGGAAAAEFIQSGSSLYVDHYYTLWTASSSEVSDTLAYQTINKWGIGNLAAAIAAGAVGIINLVALYVEYLEKSVPPFQVPLQGGDRGTYPGGLTFAWRAVPQDGWTFQSVTAESGALITQTSPGEGLLTLFGNANLSISFTENPYKLTTIPLPTAGGTVSPPGESFHKPDTEVKLYANSFEGWQFKHWGGDATGEANPGSVIMDRDDKRVTGNFVKVWKVTSKAVPEEAGFASPASLEVMDEEIVVFSASENAGFFFQLWRNADTEEILSREKQFSLKIIQDTNVLAEFVQGFKLTMESKPEGGGLTWPLGETYYPAGTGVELSALPAPGYLFVNWEGDIQGEFPEVTILMDADKTVTAVFQRATKLTTSVEPAGSGFVVPEGINYYSPTEQVVITATEAGLNKFDHFGGDVSSTDNPLTITIGETDIDVIAVFHEPVKLVTSAQPPELGSVEPAGETQQQFSSIVKLTASPSNQNDYYFSNWSGDTEGETNPLNLVMDSDKEVVGNFREFLILALSAGIGGSVSPSGTSKWQYGGNVTIIAFPEADYLFDHWSGDFEGTANPAQFVITEDMQISAVFIEAYYLTISAGEGGTVSPSGKLFLKKGTEISILAIANTEYYFSHWDGDFSGTENPIKIIVEEEAAVEAVFEEKKKLEVGANPPEGGSTSPTGTSYYMPEAEVKVWASPNETFEFTDWSGDYFRTENPIILTMTTDISITANFVEVVILRTSVEGEGSVSYPPEVKLAKGTEVTIYAIAATGWMLTGWTGDISEPAINPLVFTIMKDTNLKAVFKKSYKLTVEVSPILEPPDIAGTTIPAGVTDWAEGDFAILSAQAAKNFVFSFWSGDVIGDITQNPISILMDDDKAVTAHFLKTYHLVTNSEPEYGGSTTPDDGDYLPGEVVSIYPRPNSGFQFLYWSGDFNGFDVPAVVVMNSNRSVTAHFGRA